MITEDAPAIRGASPVDSLGPLLGPIRGFAARLTLGALQAVEASPPDGVTAADVADFTERNLDPMVDEIAALMAPGAMKLIDLAGRKGHTYAEAEIREVGARLFRSTLDELVEDLVAGRGWDSAPAAVLDLAAGQGKALRALRSHIVGQAKTAVETSGFAGLSGADLDGAMSFQARNRYAASVIQSRRRSLLEALSAVAGDSSRSASRLRVVHLADEEFRKQGQPTASSAKRWVRAAVLETRPAARITKLRATTRKDAAGQRHAAVEVEVDRDAEAIREALFADHPAYISITVLEGKPPKGRGPSRARSKPVAEVRKARDRVAANLEAMRVLAGFRVGESPTPAEREALAGYSGWGGLSLAAAKGPLRQFKGRLPIPEERGLIHEYYTPAAVCREVVRVLQPFVGTLPRTEDGRLLGLEPSAGIGRFVEAAATLEADWTAVEYSALSARLLRARFPGVTVFEGPFERWVRDAKHGFSLVLCNPPYGARGASVTEDPVRAYRESKAYAYFLRRAGDLLAPGGVGAFLIPSGLMSGQTAELRRIRDILLRGHHLMGAYRLPSGLFPGAMLVTDLVFIRRRSEALSEVHADDQAIAEGKYFATHPEMVLGTEVGKPGDDDDQTAKPRWGYQVKGTFKGLPDLVERPHCDACSVPVAAPIELPNTSDDAEAGTLDHAVQRAKSLGSRVSRYLRRLAEGEDMRAVWPGLHADLMAWRNGLTGEVAGLLQDQLARDTSDKALGSLLSVFQSDGDLIEGMAKAPTYTPPFPGSRDDIAALADWIYRLDGKVDLDALARWHASVEVDDFRTRGARATAVKWVRAQLPTLWAADWFIQTDLSHHMPGRDYLSGLLWPRVDAIDRALAGKLSKAMSSQLEAQRDRLMEAIAPVQYGDIDLVAPNLRYVPVGLLEEWVNEGRSERSDRLQLERKHGFLLPKGTTYEDYSDVSMPHRAELFLGWVNNDRQLFKPGKNDSDESIAQARRRWAEDISTEFVAWVNLETDRQDRYTAAYNRALRGFVEPVYSAEPLAIERWSDAITPRPHQTAGARRVLANRRGMLAFGVGVGKTFTGLLVLARARQEGWARRPIVLVPNSLAWKWYKDFAKVLPDYRVAVVGSSLTHRHRPFRFGRVRANAGTDAWIAANKRSKVRVQVARAISTEWTPIERLLEGDPRRAAHLRSLIKEGALDHDPGALVPRARTDTPEERAEKWRRFQAGEVDAVILTYSALGRTRLDADKIREYAKRRPSIRRQMDIDQRNARDSVERRGTSLVEITDAMTDKERKAAEKRNKQTERQKAVAKEAAAAWVAELLELPEGQKYDPGITWEDIGCDLLIVDEAQNFKNLYTPERRDGGVPKFMGGNQSSTRAWQLDFRAASVRSRSNGRGICLLSATPAKNSPLEFYSLLSLLGEDVWGDVGVDTVEAFIATFIRIEQRMVVNHRMVAEERDAVTGFTNLDVLRDIIFRYSEFKSPEDVGLKLPEVTATPVWVDLNTKQDALYEEKAAEIEELLQATNDPKKQGEILGLMMRLAMITLHPGLDETWKWTAVKKAKVEPTAPKIDAMVARVRQNPGCGHIVFAEPVASHWWMLQALVAAGIPKSRIAILNGSTAKDTALRQSIAERFNGDPDNDIEPEFDVVIANSIAYEGVDLQTRTCAIHHMDLPWEPATIEQRNGRGVRQGNTLATIGIYFYLARNSMDGARYSLIQGKHGWMRSLLNAQIKETSNPLASSEVGREELLLMLSRDPEETRKTLAAIREREEKKERRRTVTRAVRRARAVEARFRQARRLASSHPQRARKLRAEAEAMLRRVLEVDPSVWPWVTQVAHARSTDVHFPDWKPVDGAVETVPVLPVGHCIVLRDPDGEDKGQEVRIGHIDPTSRRRVGMTEVGELVWSPTAASTDAVDASRWDLARSVDLPLSHFSHKRVRELCRLPVSSEAAIDRFRRKIREGWSKAGWYLADDVWRELMWPRVLDIVYEDLGTRAYSSRGSGRSFEVPAFANGKLQVLSSSYRLRRDRPALIPPTDSGWEQFIAMAPDSSLRWTDLNRVAQYWWQRQIPRDLLSKARK